MASDPGRQAWPYAAAATASYSRAASSKKRRYGTSSMTSCGIRVQEPAEEV